MVCGYRLIDPLNKNYAQDIALKARAENKGLCGDAALAVIVGYPLHVVAETFMSAVENKEFMSGETWTNYDTNPNYLSLWNETYSSSSDIENLIKTRYAQVLDVYRYNNGTDYYNHFGDDLFNWLGGAKQYFIGGVHVDGGSGKVVLTGGVLHWITITGVSNEWYRDGVRGNDGWNNSPWKWLRIYNPYDNETEYYWWPDIRATLSLSPHLLQVRDRRPRSYR